jgi:flagellar protein FlaG
MPIYILGISMEGCDMRIEGANNNHAQRPVSEEIQVNQSVQANIAKQVEEVHIEKMAEEYAQQKNNSSFEEIQISEKMIKEAIERANKAIIGTKREFEYKKHEVLNTFMVKVINSETKETVREIPPEKIVDLVANLMELAGLLVDEKR